MIQKPNSLMLMDKIDEAVQDIKEIKNDTARMRQQIETKLGILNMYYKAASDMLAGLGKLEERTRQRDTIVFAIDQDKIIDGKYILHGQTIHPDIVGIPDQMFNFLTSSGALFKDNVSVSFVYEKETVTDGNSEIEEVSDEKYEYCNLLRDETDTSKKDVFHYFQTPHVKMIVEIKPGNLIGNTNCNMIEICPYLPGTFTINSIKIWTIDQYLSQNTDGNPAGEIGPLPQVGSERIILDTTYQIYRAEFDISLHWQCEGFPFGLRHLYFCDAKLDNTNSYVIVKVSKNSYIASIGSAVTVLTPEETVRYPDERNPYGAAINQQIEYYASYENGTLQVPLKANTILPRNVMSFYAKIPLFEPIIAISFDNIITR